MADITVLVQSPGLSVWGGTPWGELAWSQQSGTTAQTGQVQAFNNLGWGGNTWNFGANWGDLANTSGQASTLLASTALTPPTITVIQEVSVNGLSLQTNIGDEEAEVLNNGWGIKGWGEFAWGLTGTVLLEGQSLSTTTGQAIASIDGEANVQGSSLQTNVGDSASRIDADAFPDGSRGGASPRGARGLPAAGLSGPR